MGYKQYCKNYQDIENYEKAKKDGFKGWECHHRLETHTPDGIRRDVDISHKELKALGMYYNRPASELIFLTVKEHNAFKKGRRHSDEAKNKMREAKKGKKLSEETKNKMREAKKGKHHSDETRKKLSEANIGEKNPFYGKHHSEETKKKLSEARKNISEETKKKMGEANKGTRWYNDGKINKRAKECPKGFVPGMLR